MVLSKERLTQDGVWLWSQHSDLGVPDQLWVCRLVHLVLGAVAWPLDRIKSHGRQLKRLCAPLSQFSSEMNKGMCAHELRLAKNCFHHFYIKATIRQKNKQTNKKQIFYCRYQWGTQGLDSWEPLHCCMLAVSSTVNPERGGVPS